MDIELATATIADRNKSVVRRFVVEVIGCGRLRLLPELVDENYIGHLMTGDHYGPDGLSIDVMSYRSALPDLAVTLEDLIADGDVVARRFTMRGTHAAPLFGTRASGKTVALETIAIDRLAGGKLVESWVQVDCAALARTAHGRRCLVGGGRESPATESPG